MPSQHPLRQTQTINYSTASTGAKRHPSNASTDSSAYSAGSNPFLLSRTSTMSSTCSLDGRGSLKGHKRGISEATGLHSRTAADGYTKSTETSPGGGYKSVRLSLKPLAQPPSSTVPRRSEPPHWSLESPSDVAKSTWTDAGSKPQSPKDNRPASRGEPPALNRAETLPVTAPNSYFYSSRGQHQPHTHAHTVVTAPDLESLHRSSTGHFRTLSRLAGDGSNADFSISSPAEEVVGLHGRRRLQRTGSVRGDRGLGKSNRPVANEWIDRNWMDKQRQFLQAYEYLCHIGEAKEWIEDVIHKPIPPIVQLEEALRDGVTLAEVVQALKPAKPLRIFRHQKLQFRHSDNIALFFRYLAEVELPELFRFELIDLYEKKNIPKVIYCIHALSWLLYRKGILQFRIGNLVGQLEFERHELEEMQKGLDRAGITMPSFSGMGASFCGEPDPKPKPEPEPIPEPERAPVETEEDRIRRELAQVEPIIVELQAQAHGAVLRIKLGDMMQQLWDAEEMLVQLQSRLRGTWARQVVGYRLDMRRFAVNLQSAARGYLVRSQTRTRQAMEDLAVAIQSVARGCLVRSQTRTRQAAEGLAVAMQSATRGMLARKQHQASIQQCKAQQTLIIQLQSAARAAQVRNSIHKTVAVMHSQEQGISMLQAAVRGTMYRREVARQAGQTRATEPAVGLLQAAARRHLVRKTLEQDKQDLLGRVDSILRFQATARAALHRLSAQDDQQVLNAATESCRLLQANTRGFLARRQFRGLRSRLNAASGTVSMLQAAARGYRVRTSTSLILEELSREEEVVRTVQALARGMLLRQRSALDKAALRSESANIRTLQSVARGRLFRTRFRAILSSLELHEAEIIDFQGLARAMLLRHTVGSLLEELDSLEDHVVMLQAATRGSLIRSQFKEKQRYFRENMEKVIKVQSFVRGRLQGEAYKSLTTGKNPPVGTVKNFVHLLNDSDFDFDEEIEFERIRKTVVQHVRQNELAEQYIDQLDIKIALLVKNKITLDEVVKHQRHFGGHVGSLLTNSEMSSKDPFDLKALNKNSRRKLEHYQQLFFVLQTQPQYLARLFRRLREQGTAEKDCRRIEHLMLGLFGYAQKRREEYYLLKLIVRSIKEEIDSSGSLQDYVRGNFFWSRLMTGYVRSPRDRKYMRDLLGPIVREHVIDNPDLDLESDPMQIYLSAINNEELRTGQRSRRRPDVTREEAIKDPETRKTFTDNLQDLRDIADQFIAALDELLPKMPYGVRYVAQQMFEHLVSRYSHEPKNQLLQLVGNWVWKSYLQPAMTQPETWGVVDRGLTSLQKRNLGEVAKVVSQIAVGKLFGGDNVFLQPLNSYVAESVESMGHIWENVISVREAEEHFDIDEFNDLYARTKPTLYIKMSDIFAIHQLVASEVGNICPGKDDIITELVHDLGSAKSNESEMLAVSSAEINLTLNPRLHDVPDPDAECKSLFVEMKRCVLYIIRVQSGPSLMDILVTPITADDERRWQAIVREEFAGPGKRRGAYSESNSLGDITSMTYSELKRIALENVVRLERLGRVSRHDHYQDLLNAIAVDIRTKHRRRIQRQRELEGVRLTLANLNEKALWLEQQLKSYNDYIEQAMVTLQNKKGKKRFLLPFTKQYNHERELQRTGRVPKFGSFKYSARSLAEKGVLVSYEGYAEKQYEKINLTISSDAVGVFFIEGSVGSIQIPGASAHVPLDDLLQAQFNNHQFMTLFEGHMRLNVNLFLHLLFRKFYRDE